MSKENLPLEGKLIAFFHQSSDMYGSDKVLLYLAEGVLRLGGKPVVLVPNAGPLTCEFTLRNIEFHILPMLKITRARLSLKGLFGLLCELCIALPAYDRIFGSRHVDLVHSNTLAVLGGALWSRRRGIPHLWHVHEIIEHPRIAAYTFPLLLRIFADQVVCNSNATYHWLLGVQSGLKKKMRVIWNGVHGPRHMEQDCVEQIYRRFRPAGSQLAIGLVGRINRWKGHGLLLNAIELLHKRGVGNFSVVFMGSPPPGQENFEVELKQRIAQSPLRDHIVVEGFSSEIWPAYAALDIVCVPSTEPEPFGLVAVEAMAAEKPLVVSRFGGLIEIVVDGITGLTFNPGDATSLAAELEKLLTDAALRRRLGRAGKERFDSEFSVEKMQIQFSEIFESMISDHSHGMDL